MIDIEKISPEPVNPRSRRVPLLITENQRFDTDRALIDHLLLAAALKGASDFSVMSDSRVHLQINGRQYFGTDRSLSHSEVDIMLATLWRSADATGIIRQGRVLDFAYEIAVDRFTRQRYRINATGITINGGEGVELSVRCLPNRTPSLDDIEFESEIRDYLTPKSGIIIVAGGTGHGKSTTLAAMTRAHLENTAMPRKIIDYQAPIEFTFRDLLENNVENPAFIAQSEVGEGRNLPSFGKAIWASLRRAPQIINVGEARDHESMAGCLAAALQGHIVNTTTHAGSVAEALRRMVLEFPAAEQKSRAYDLVTALRLVVVQHLVPSPDFKERCVVREYLVFTDSVRDRFVATPFEKWTQLVSDLFKQAYRDRNLVARALSQSIERRIKTGKLTPASARDHLGSLYCAYDHRHADAHGSGPA
ncbi:type IV pilus twitching motility protein PilT [Brucella pseudogrignonensis]